eukprot:gene29995-37140_t
MALLIYPNQRSAQDLKNSKKPPISEEEKERVRVNAARHIAEVNERLRLEALHQKSLDDQKRREHAASRQSGVSTELLHK